MSLCLSLYMCLSLCLYLYLHLSLNILGKTVSSGGKINRQTDAEGNCPRRFIFSSGHLTFWQFIPTAQTGAFVSKTVDYLELSIERTRCFCYNNIALLIYLQMQTHSSIRNIKHKFGIFWLNILCLWLLNSTSVVF